MAPVMRTPLSKEARETALAARVAETLAHNKRKAEQRAAAALGGAPGAVGDGGVVGAARCNASMQNGLQLALAHNCQQ